MALDLVDDGLVLEDGAVVLEIDRLGRLGEDLDFAACVIVSFLEVGEGGCGLAFEAERGADLGPVDFESCAALSGQRSTAPFD